MGIRFSITGLLGVAAALAVSSTALAGECKVVPEEISGSSQRGFCFVERDLVEWGVLDGGTMREGQPRPGIPTSSATLGGDDIPSVEYETAVHAGEEWAADWAIYLGPSSRDEEGSIEPTIVFGLKYSFKAFQLDQFRESFLSFVSNGKGMGKTREKAVEFYVDIP